MATVFSNSQVAHVWAQQRQEEGRSHNGQFYFRGRQLFSYGSHFLVGQFVTNKRGERAVLLNSDSYSPTTGRHQSYARQAVGGLGLPIFHTPGASHDYRDALSRMTEKAGELAASAGRMRSQYRKDWATTEAVALLDEAEALARFAGIRWRRPASLEAIALEIGKAKLREVKRRKLEAAKQRQRDAERFAEWQAGAPVYCPDSYRTDEHGGAHIRIVGDELQTSMGARVPLAHAVRAFRFIKLVRQRGEAWQSNGHSIRVGPFTVDRIEANGDMRAGCHTFKWAEIEHAAQVAHVADEPAAADALEG